MATDSYEERWSPSRVEECVQLWDLTPREHSQLLAFGDCIHDVNHWKNDPFEVIRFLKEFQFHLKTTEHKFRASIKWRLEHGADTILHDYTPPALYNYFPLAVLKGVDRDGDPIYVERSGAADTLGLLHRFGKDEMIKQAIWGKELMTRGPWQGRRSKRVKHFTTILDLKGLNRHHLNPSLVPVGQAVTRLVQDNYPGFGKKILVIRAPAFFRFVWNVFKHFVDPHVKDLIEIATEKETPQLLQQYMDLRVLPKEMLPDIGQGQAEDGYEPIWEGGPLPPPSKDDWRRGTPVFFGKDVTTTPTTPTTTHAAKTTTAAAIVTPQSTSTPTLVVKNSLLMDSSSSTSSPMTASSQSPPPQTPIQPIQPTISVTSMSTMSSSSDANNWEALSPPPPLHPSSLNSSRNHKHKHKPHVPQLQAWTVTPQPLSRNHTQTVWSADNFQQMVDLWQLTQIQQVEMQQLRQRLVDVHHWKNDPHEVVRYYLEYASVDKAEQAFRDMVAWRIEHEMDHLLERYQEQPPDPLFHFMPLAMLQGFDRDGDPIYIDRVGVCDYPTLLAHFGHAAVIQYVTLIAELNSSRRFWQQTCYEQEVGHRVRHYTLLIDLEGLGWHQYLRPGLVHFLKQVSRLLQDNYAGWEKRILFIRAPAIFKLMWSLVKHFFDPHIRAKIQVAGHANYLALLDKYMDRKVLPPEICPKDGMGTVMPGYYENVKLKGGPIPKQALQKAKKKAPGYGSQSIPVFPLATATKTPSHTIISRSAPMPPSTSDNDDNDDNDDEMPPSPVSTTRLMAGYWDDIGKEQVDEGSSSARAAGPEQKKLFASPMFKYNW